MKDEEEINKTAVFSKLTKTIVGTKSFSAKGKKSQSFPKKQKKI